MIDCKLIEKILTALDAAKKEVARYIESKT